MEEKSNAEVHVIMLSFIQNDILIIRNCYKTHDYRI